MRLFDSEKKKYITRGIDTEIPIYYQIIILRSIETWLIEEVTMDYLQVFKLEVEINDDGSKIQVIKHSQEVPEKSEEIRVPLEEGQQGINEKIFVIDDGADYYTMLLASEY